MHWRVDSDKLRSVLDENANCGDDGNAYTTLWAEKNREISPVTVGKFAPASLSEQVSEGTILRRRRRYKGF